MEALGGLQSVKSRDRLLLRPSRQTVRCLLSPAVISLDVEEVAVCEQQALAK